MKSLIESLGPSLVDDNRQNIFVIVKPGFLEDTAFVIDEFAKRGWRVDRIRTKQLLPEEAKRLYEPHKKEDFFKDLCKYMSSAPSTAILFVKDGSMSSKMFAETDKIKDHIRKEIGESEMRNGIHSSDSLERLQIERGIYF
jgi:nucleoside-diphosphate kinase